MTEDSSISVTLKQSNGKDKDAPWIVLRGSTVEDVKRNLLDVFGWPDEQKSLTLHELTVNAHRALQGAGNISSTLGAVVLRDGGLTDAPTMDDAVANPALLDQAMKEQKASERADEDPNAGLIKALESAESIDRLKGLWAKHQDAFSDQRVKDAYSARGRALKAQGN